MNCPKCNDNSNIEINLHSDGYADNLLECASCGTIWIETPEETILLNNVHVFLLERFEQPH